MSLISYKLQNLKLVSKFAIVSLIVVGCKGQNATTAENQAPVTTASAVTSDVLGTYGSSTLKNSELTGLEKQELYSAQKKVYDAAQAILEQRYLDSWYADYQTKNKISSLDEAKKDFYDKNAMVTDQQVQSFLKENASNPQLQQIPVKDRAEVVKQYLTRAAHEKADQDLIQKAEDGGQIKVAMERPVAPSIKLSDVGYKYKKDLPSPKVTVVEFADYQCPYCVKASTEVDQLLSAYKDNANVQFVYRDFPLTSIHPEALPAAIAAKCAANQGKFWEMHNRIFARSPMDPINADSFTKFATDLKLNLAQFKACQQDEAQKNQVMADLNEGVSVGVNGTPTFYINGQKFEQNPNFASFKKEIDRILAD